MMEIFDIYLLEAMVNGILLGGVLALLALGLNLIFGVIEVARAGFSRAMLEEGVRRAARLATVCPVNDPYVADAARFDIHAPANGTYAIAVVHDENGNNKMDKAIFLPREGFGFSRNPAIAMGPPSFKSASFAVAGDMRQSIKMKYML